MKNREIKLSFTPKGNVALECIHIGEEQLIMGIMSLTGALANMTLTNVNEKERRLSKKEVKAIFDGLSEIYMKTVNVADMDYVTDYDTFEEKYDELIERENKSKPSNVINSKFKI